jgi:hypothetical protein
MSTTDPQFLYMILVLPSVFGLTLIGDGFNKVIKQESGGILGIIFGFVFIGMVVFAYLFFSTYLSK